MAKKKKATGKPRKGLPELARQLNNLYGLSLDPSKPDVMDQIIKAWGRRRFPFYSGGPGAVGLVCEELCRRLIDRKRDRWAVTHDDSSSSVRIVKASGHEISISVLAVEVLMCSNTIDDAIMHRVKFCWTDAQKEITKKYRSKDGSPTMNRFQFSNPHMFDDIVDYYDMLAEDVQII